MFDARACAASDDACAPRVVITGGNFSAPHTTPSQPATAPQLAHIDWLGFTINIADMGEQTANELLIWFLLEFHSFSDFFVYEDRRKGWMGYKQSYDIEHGSGLLAFGGDHQRSTLHVELTGKGCTAIKNWGKLREWLERMQAKITRLDIAHDDHEGKTINLELCKRWLQEGLFSCGKAEPARKLLDDLGSGKGSTLYVGKRANGKMFRGYEKGKQLGDPNSTWFRAEVEWRAKDRVIPFDALTDPGKYLAGSFPALAFISAVQDKIRTLRTSIKTTVEQAITNAKQQAGKLINLLVTDLGWQPADVIQTLRRDGVPERLKPFKKHLNLAGAT